MEYIFVKINIFMFFVLGSQSVVLRACFLVYVQGALLTVLKRQYAIQSVGTAYYLIINVLFCFSLEKLIAGFPYV